MSFLIRALRTKASSALAQNTSSVTKYCCSLDDVMSAQRRIRPYVRNTPIVTSASLDSLSGHKMFLKADNFQKTGSFKFRGATNAVLKIKQNSPDVHCVVTHSSGNHGLALACAAKSAGIDCYVVMPENSAKCKIESVHRYGAQVVLCAPSEKARTEGANQLVQRHGGVYISTSQNSDVIAGQGTLGLEILKENPDIDVIVSSVGGGGLAAGIATAIKAVKPSVKVLAAEPEMANDCYVSKKLGILTPNPVFPNTIADGVRASVGPIAWPMVRDLIDDVITVTEDEIKAATLLVWQRCKLVIEPSAGVAVASVLSKKFDKKMLRHFGILKPQNVAVVLCGGNIDFSIFPELLN